MSSISYTSSYFKYHFKLDDKTIKTVVTNDCDVVDAWVKEILVAHADSPKVVVGFHVKYESWDNIHTHGLYKCSTLNLCTETNCIVLQLKFIKGIPQSLKNFFMNPSITFVGTHEDFTKFVCDYDLECAKSEDIRAAVIKKWPRMFQRHDFEYLAKELAGLNLDRPSDHKHSYGWENRVLDDNFVMYACNVAYAAYKIGNVLLLKPESTEPRVITNGN